MYYSVHVHVHVCNAKYTIRSAKIKGGLGRGDDKLELEVENLRAPHHCYEVLHIHTLYMLRFGRHTSYCSTITLGVALKGL